MAASVLGKRRRELIEAEEIVVVRPTRSCKRRTRQGALHIHDDSEQVSTASKSLSTAPIPSVDPPQHGCKISSWSRTERRSYAQNEVQGDSDSAGVNILQDENVPPADFETPTTTRFKDALTKIPVTPRHRVRIPRQSFTPRTPRTETTCSPRSHSVYAAARQLFTQSSLPGKLVGRDEERNQLTTFIETGIGSKTGGCTYISGPPGTGKSALVHEIFEGFQHLPTVKAMTVNCVSIKSSKDLYLKLTDEFCQGASLVGKSAKNALTTLFTVKKEPITVSHLVILDELDSLLDGDCEVLYSLFDWALHRSSNLILIGIANALDFTDRFLPRLKARNLRPQLLPFLPYTANNIAQIITDRLRSVLPANSPAAKEFVPFMHPAAVQLCSKKVASQTGDLRKAFNLVRRAIDEIERESSQKYDLSVKESPSKQPLVEISNFEKQQLPTPPNSSPLKGDFVKSPASKDEPVFTPETAPRASIAHVARLSSKIFNNGTTSRLNALNLQQKAVLCSLVANENKRANRDPFTTPSKSTIRIPTVRDLFVKYTNLCHRDEGVLQPLRNGEFRDVIASLEVLGLVHESAGRGSTLLTPSKTPTRMGGNPDDKQVISAVSRKEMMESLQGPGANLLLRLFDES